MSTSNKDYPYNTLHNGFIRGFRSVLPFVIGYPLLALLLIALPIVLENGIVALDIFILFAVFAAIPLGLAISAYLTLGTITGGLIGAIAGKVKSHITQQQFQIIVLILTGIISVIVYFFLAHIFDDWTRPETNLKEVIVPGVRNSILILLIPLVYYVGSMTWSSRDAYNES